MPYTVRCVQLVRARGLLGAGLNALATELKVAMGTRFQWVFHREIRLRVDSGSTAQGALMDVMLCTEVLL